MYPKFEGKTFDVNYYKNQYIKLVKEKLAPIKIDDEYEIDNQNGQSSYFAVTRVLFESWEQFENQYIKNSKELSSDRLKFTNSSVIIQTSELK